MHGLEFVYLSKFHGQNYVTNLNKHLLLYINLKSFIALFKWGEWMNNLERHEARYLRRKAKRENKIKERSNFYADLDRAFTFSKVMYYADKCCKGVGYKKSTQNFKLHMFTIIATTCRNIKTGDYVVSKTYKFKINERGKIRDIDAPHITDRLVHKVLSNEIILPIYMPHIIYDNGASMKNKGFFFAIKRIKYKLHNWYLKHGLNGYIVTIDFSKFFQNCSHNIIHDIHKKYIYDDEVIKIIEDYLFIGEGIALGVEIAQREACIIPNLLDHYIQNQSFPMERYMDDTFLIVKTLHEAEKLLQEYYQIAENLKIVINKNKTRIIPIGHYFLYCKWKYCINKNGKIVCVPHKDTIYRERRKLKKMYKLDLDSNEIEITRSSFIAYLNQGNSYKYVKYLIDMNLEKDLFIELK